MDHQRIHAQAKVPQSLQYPLRASHSSTPKNPSYLEPEAPPGAFHAQCAAVLTLATCVLNLWYLHVVAVVQQGQHFHPTTKVGMKEMKWLQGCTCLKMRLN
eukprot:scaffold43925_cov21-Tisochrysis_lutea.AAC.1